MRIKHTVIIIITSSSGSSNRFKIEKVVGLKNVQQRSHARTLSSDLRVLLLLVYLSMAFVICSQSSSNEVDGNETSADRYLFLFVVVM